MSITVYTIQDLLDLKPPAWLITGVIPEQGLAALYGQPGDGKSFLALDMALSVAAGVPWQGHPVQKGFVVYISAEGGAGIGKRVGAWLAFHNIPRNDYQYITANFVVSALRIHPESGDMAETLDLTVNDPEWQEHLASVLTPDEDHPPLFIIVDTLARCFEGDENQQEDMGNFIKGLDTLRDDHGATVLVLHHTGKQGFEERGSSAFRGACDTMMLVTKADTTLSLSCTKQKDAEPFQEEEYEMVVVPKWESCTIQSAVQRTDMDREAILNYYLEHPTATVREISGALNISVTTTHRRLTEIKREINTPLKQP